FLTLWAAQEIDRQAIVHLSDCRCLRPAVWPVRRNSHEPILIQKLKNLGSQSVVHKPSANCGSRAKNWPMDGSTALMQVNTTNASAAKSHLGCHCSGAHSGLRNTRAHARERAAHEIDELNEICGLAASARERD